MTSERRGTIDHLRDDLNQVNKDIHAMQTLMSNCYSDEAYRDYSKTMSSFVAKKIKLEKLLADLEEAE